MAIDEMLLGSQAALDTAPTLRFYTWSVPAYSVGYFQDVDEIFKRFQSAKTSAPVVRRVTGGGLVFHGQDVTFSVTAKENDPFFSGEVKDSYLKVNEALRVGLKAVFQGIDFADCKTIPSGRGKGNRICFEAPSCYDLLLYGKKIVGASQRRKNNTVLYQSSVFLDGSEKIICAHIIRGFKKKWHIDFLEKPLSSEELLSAQKIEGERYVSSDWVRLERSFCS